MKAYVDEIDSPAGPLAFAVDEDGALMRLHFVQSDYGPVMERDLEDEGYAVEVDETRTAAVRRELSEYANGERKTFDVRLAFAGSEWQKAVWTELTRIPFGETRTYGEMAEAIGAPRAVRAVARACAQNHVSLAVPCHRVVGKDGDLTGYRWGVPRKRALLAKERAGKA